MPTFLNFRSINLIFFIKIILLVDSEFQFHFLFLLVRIIGFVFLTEISPLNYFFENQTHFKQLLTIAVELHYHFIIIDWRPTNI